MTSANDLRDLGPLSRVYRHWRGAEVRKNLARFQSLGDNCEFGLVQKRWGVDQLGLFRYAGTTLPSLVAALEDGFREFTRPGGVQCFRAPSDGEYLIHAGAQTSYAMVLHTWVFGDNEPDASFREDQETKFRFLVRHLIEELEDADKIFVFRTLRDHGADAAARLFKALGRYGRNRLLWVTEAAGDCPSGAVVEESGGLYRGCLKRLAPYEDAFDSLDLHWIKLCARVEKASSPPSQGTARA